MDFKNPQSLFVRSAIIGGGLLFALAVSAAPWTGPTGAPPANNPAVSSGPWTTSGSDIYYNSGNVGIGTNNPGNNRLQVVAPTGSNLVTRFNAAGAGTYFLMGPPSSEVEFNVDSSGNFNLNHFGGATGALKSIRSGAVENTIVLNAGKVGIGKAAPVDVLDVAGVLRGTGLRARAGVNGGTGNVFNFNWVGAFAQVWVDTTFVGAIAMQSDERLKKNIKTLTPLLGLDAIKALNPVSFNWRDEAAGDSIQYGFIAQEVREVLPDLVRNTGMVSTSTPDGALNIEYNGLFAPLTKAVQELDTKLEDKVRSLEQELTGLKKEIEALKAR